MDKNNHKCIICGAEYHHCDDCSNMKSFTPWRSVCDTKEHFQVYMLFNDIKNNRISDNEAKISLENIGVSKTGIELFNEPVKDVLLPILSGSKTVKSKNQVSVEDNIVKSEEDVNDKTTEDDSFASTFRRKKTSE